MAPEREVKYRNKLPTVLVSLDSNNPRDELFTQKTILTITKNGRTSSQSVSKVSRVSSSKKIKVSMTQDMSKLGTQVVALKAKRDTSPLSGSNADGRNSGRRMSHRKQSIEDITSAISSTEGDRALNLKISKNKN